MASGATSRLALPYPLSTDPTNVPGDVQALASALDTKTVVYQQGTAAARPATPATMTIYYATDTAATSFYDGVAWQQVSPYTRRETHIYAVGTSIAVASGATNYLPPFPVSVPTSTTLVLVNVYAFLRTGTASIQLNHNGAAMTGFGTSGVIAVTSTPTLFTPSGGSISMADADLIAPVVNSVGSTPDGLTLAFRFDRTQ